MKPGILVLNETWLKSSIRNDEIIHDGQYKIYRLDRSAKTHPPDSQNPNKYRINGGGVLIAIRSNLNIISTQISYKCSAEILGALLLLRMVKNLFYVHVIGLEH